MKEIILNRKLKTRNGKPITKGFVALVDDSDYEWLNKYYWTLQKHRYTYYALTGINGKSKRMHRLIMDAKKGQLIDHRDRNGLNNQRNNLRFCTYTENRTNSRPKKNCTSKYLGVNWDKDNSKWVASIRKNKKVKYLGWFTDEIDAAKKYDEYAKLYFGEFAYLNFPESVKNEINRQAT